MPGESHPVRLMNENETWSFDAACRHMLSKNKSWVLSLLQASDIDIKPLLEPLLVNYIYYELMQGMQRLFLPADIAIIYQQFNQSNQGG
jgi:hypothetical protein